LISAEPMLLIFIVLMDAVLIVGSAPLIINIQSPSSNTIVNVSLVIEFALTIILKVGRGHRDENARGTITRQRL
jgi:hypothetical protein